MQVIEPLEDIEIILEDDILSLMNRKVGKFYDKDLYKLSDLSHNIYIYYPRGIQINNRFFYSIIL